MHRHRRRSIMSTQSVTLSALAATVLLVTAACSSSGSSSGSDASSQQIPVVSVSLPSADPLSSDVILAQQLGYFTKLNVKLDLVTTGVTGMNQVSAGRRDLELSGTPSAFPPSAAGNATQSAAAADAVPIQLANGSITASHAAGSQLGTAFSFGRKRGNNSARDQKASAAMLRTTVSAGWRLRSGFVFANRRNTSGKT